MEGNAARAILGLVLGIGLAFLIFAAYRRLTGKGCSCNG